MSKLYLLLSLSLFSSYAFAQPADEDFSDDASTNFSNLALTLTNDGVTYFQDGVLADGHYIEILESSQYTMAFPIGSKAVVYNVGQASGGSYYGYRSQDGSEFRLASMAIDIIGNAGGANFADEYVIRGYRNGVQQVSQTVNFSSSGTSGSITYTLNGTYYLGGTLAFSSSAEWKNIDEIRFYWNNNGGMIGAIKSIDFEPAITGPLPVSLLDYSATLRADGKVRVQWSTADETNNSHFIIERAINSTDFRAIGRVEGNGTQTNRADYSFTDAAPLTGTSYYRLVQYDLNGNHKIYQVLMVRKSPDGSLSVYPNPVTGNGFTIRLKGTIDSPVRYTLNNMAGKVIRQGVITVQQQFIQLPSSLPKGTYFLMMGDGTGSKVLIP